MLDQVQHDGVMSVFNWMMEKVQQYGVLSMLKQKQQAATEQEEGE